MSKTPKKTVEQAVESEAPAVAPETPHEHALVAYQANILAAYKADLDNSIRGNSDALAALADRLLQFGSPEQIQWMRAIAALLIDVLDGKVAPQ